MADSGSRNDEVTARDGPLAGVRIVDLTHFVAGPWGTMILADHGADVIKVEPPRGEIGRGVGRVYVGDQNAIFLGFNRGKRSITVDLKHPEGVGVVHRLVETADVVVDNFRPGTAARLGVDHAALSAANPRVISLSLSAFGPSGPYRDRPANDPIIQGLTGVMAESGDPEGEPLRLGVSMPDFAGGLVSALAILAGLHVRQQTGRGLEITSSLLAAQLFSQLDVAIGHLDERAQRVPLLHLGAALASRSVGCSDGRDVVLAPDDEPSVVALLALVGADPSDPPEAAALQAQVASYAATRSAVDVLEACANAGVPAAEVKHLAAVFADGAGAALIGEYDHPSVGRVRHLRVPSGTTRPSIGPPPRLGEHTLTLLTDLGYDAPDRRHLFETGAVGPMPRDPDATRAAAPPPTQRTPLDVLRNSA